MRRAGMALLALGLLVALAPAAVCGAPAAPAAPAALACPRAWHGLRFAANATLAYRRVAPCGERPAYTCCGREHDAALARADAACRDAADAPCCAALQALRCVACDGAAQLGIVTGVAPALCAHALGECAASEFSVDATGSASLCGPQ